MFLPIPLNQYATNWIVAGIHAVVYIAFIIIYFTRVRHYITKQTTENSKIFLGVWTLADAVCVTSLVLRNTVELDSSEQNLLWFLIRFLPNMTTIMAFLVSLLCW